MSGYRIKGLVNEKNKTTGYRIKGLADENQDQKGFGAIASDIVGLPKQVAKGLYKAVLETGIGAPSAVKQLTNKDSTLHSIGNVAAGAFTTARDIANIPSSLQSYLEGKLGSIPEAIKNSPLKYTSMAGLNIPHIPEDLGIEQTLGLDTRNRADVTLRNLGGLGANMLAPGALGIKIPSVTARGIIKDIVKEKSARISKAGEKYTDLFVRASKEGHEYAAPTPSIIRSESSIINNSPKKYHTSLKEYLETPTLENAHKAQSDLGALQRHLEGIDERTGLTKSQRNTLKKTEETRSGIKQAMFGQESPFNKEYMDLSKEYATEVVPYKNLRAISKYEKGNTTAKRALQRLQMNDEFMAKIAQDYPGLNLHTSRAKNIFKALAGVLGIEGAMKFFK